MPINSSNLYKVNCEDYPSGEGTGQWDLRDEPFCSSRRCYARTARFLKLILLVLIALLLTAVLATLVLIFLHRIAAITNADDPAFLNRDRHWQLGKCAWACNTKFATPPLLLISLDGFYSGYLERELTPAIKRVSQCGSHSKYMYPSYPSKTFPNHYAIVTGLYPESHGIIDNNMFDDTVSDSQKFFKKNSLCADWYKGEPIWNTVLKNDRKSAVFYWPGSELHIQGKIPTYRMSYNSTTPHSTRIEKIIDWLNLPEGKRPSFIAMYLEQPDRTAHGFGPDSDEVNSALISVDAMLNYLMFRLDKASLLGCINIVIISDHGMQELREDHSVIIEELVDEQSILSFGGPVGQIHFKNKANTNITASIQKLKCQKGALYNVYERETIPQRYHYTRSERIGDVIIEGVPGTFIYSTFEEMEKSLEKADHGYDNRLRTMRAIFAAMGPSIKAKNEIQPFQNIELYNLFADLMELSKRAPNNGTRGVLHSVLRNPPEIRETETEVVRPCADAYKFQKCGQGCFTVNLEKMDEFCSVAITTRLPKERTDVCSVKLCNASVVYDNATKRVLFVESLLTFPRKNIDDRADCVIDIQELSVDKSPTGCRKVSPSPTVTLFANDAKYRFIRDGQVGTSKGFAEGIWASVWELIENYRKHYKRLYLIAGPIFDSNFDGLADSEDVLIKNNVTQPTHIFIILYRCGKSKWSPNGVSCLHANASRVLSFSLPNVPNDFNCLIPEEYLFRHTVRVRDIELLTATEFFTDRSIWTAEVALRMRTSISEELWQLEIH